MITGRARPRSTTNFAKIKIMVNWDETNEIVGTVFEAKVYSHGISNISGMWARVQSAKGRSTGQRTDHFNVLLFRTKADAREGSGVQCVREEDFTLAQLKGHAGVGRRAGEDSGDEVEGENGDEGAEEAEAACGARTPAGRTPGKEKAKKAAQAEKKAMLQGALAEAGLVKEDVVSRMKAAGVESVQDFRVLGGAGRESLSEIASAAGLSPLEKAALGRHMDHTSRASVMQRAYAGGDSDEDEEDADSDGGDGEAPELPAKAAKGGGTGKDKYPLLACLLAGVPKGRKEAAALDVLEGVCDAFGKVPSERETRQVMASAEAKLRVMKFTKAQLKPAPPGGEEEVSALVTEICTGWEKPQEARGGRGGVAEGQVATVATGRQEPGMASALAQVVAQPELMETIEKLMASGDAARTVQELSRMGNDESFAAMAHKSGDLTVPQGVPQTHTVLGVVHGLGRLRQVWAEWVAGQLREGPYLPAGADALAIAWKLVSRDVCGIDLAQLYKCEAAGSMLGSLGGGSAAPRGDSTSDAMLVVMRGLAMLLRGYCAAHPFDGTVATTFTRLQAEVVCAVQQGVHVAEAWKTLVDPFLREVGRKWKEVGRLAGARPVLGLVAKEQLVTQAVKGLREHAASCTPVVQTGAAEVKKLRSDLEASKATVAELKQRLAAKVGAPAAGGGGARDIWEAQDEHKGMCYHWTLHKSCRFGAKCRRAAQPGHPQ